jgi:hypothetical protein
MFFFFACTRGGEVLVEGAGSTFAHPIMWLLIASRIQDPQKKKAITDFLRWVIHDKS